MTKEKRKLVLQARAAGATLRDAAKAAGVHVATVCRWQAKNQEFRKSLYDAGWAARRGKYVARPRGRPRVPWSRICPMCHGTIVVRTIHTIRFWRCEDWPRCRFASWRPRFTSDCPKCTGPLFWAHSRRSVGCAKCGLRLPLDRSRKCESCHTNPGPA